MNQKTGLLRWSGDEAMYHQALHRFAADYGSAATALARLFASDSATRLADAQSCCHKVRGVAANLGATQVAGLTAEAEAILHRDHPDPAALDAALAVLDQALQRLAADARQLSASTNSLPQGNPIAHDLPQKLAELHSLLQNNNLKALDVLRQLRPAPADAGGWGALAEAVETLDFTAAQAIVADMLHRKDSA
nr:Hpt domain-containing protein [Duganella vulcania]